jgi:beta-glucosidase
MMSAAAYKNSTLSIGQRVADLLPRMTLDEKIAQLGSVWPNHIGDGESFSPKSAADAMPDGIGHITRIAASSLLAPPALAQYANQAQRWLIEETRLGIPAIIHEESCAGFTAKGATQFPQAIGLASTWNPALIEEVASVIRQQMMAVGARQTLAPILDIVRDARWGRVEEAYGEDPYLAGRLGVAYVRGLQGNDIRDGVIATGKHFLGYGAGEGGMNWAPAHLGWREIREIYARPFEEAIREAGLASIMNSYNEVDGEPAGASKALLTNLLRGEIGFEGTVVADYFTVTTLMSYHKIAGDKAEAAARALAAGIDVELPQISCYRHLPEAISRGLIDESAIEAACERVLRQKFELGLFDDPFVDEAAAAGVLDTADHRSLARRAAHQSIVMLKNDGGLLPLSPEGIGRIVVVGPAADSIRLLQGDYHYPTHLEMTYGQINEAGEEAAADDPTGSSVLLPTSGSSDVRLLDHFVFHVTLLDGIRSAVSKSTTVIHARGCGTSGDDRSGIAEAVSAAAEADVAVLCVGTRSGLVGTASSGEFTDRSDLGLPGAQQALVDAVLDTGTPTVVVLVNGGVLSMPHIAERALAILEAWLPGEEGGNAVADILFGTVSPSGRLPLSLPRTVGQMPIFYNHKPSGGRSNVREHYVDSPSTPLYPFGHGLSYSSFEYGPIGIREGHIPADGAIDIEIDITNTGERPGDEVVQLYLHDLLASVTRPVKQLAGFARVHLAPEETNRVVFSVDVSQLAFYDSEMRLVVEPGDVEILIGASSEDIRQRATVSITGETRALSRAEIRPTTVAIRPHQAT